MKKLFLFALICALVLSLCSLPAVAEIDLSAWGLSYTPGYFAGESGDAFSPVGDALVPWAPDVSAKTDMSDGDVSDWKALGCTPLTIGENQMVSWIGGEKGVRDPGMPADWGIEFYFMADADYLYLIFDVTDSDFVYGNDAGPYNGDAIQLSIDLGARLEETLEYNPDDLVNPKGIFYSFACQGDGAPVQIMRQESDNDGIITEANGDGVKGATRRTEKGWSAEIALSWQQLYDDYSWKAWDDKQLYVGGIANYSLNVGMALIYINHTESGDITWAASTTRGLTNEKGVPLLSWTAVDNGIQLELPIDEDVSFNCDGIAKIYVFETIPTPPEAACTEPVREPDTEPAEEWVTELPEVEYAPYPITPMPPVFYETAEVSEVEYVSEAATLDPALEAVLEKYGCSASAGFGAMALLTIAAAFVALKKKH